MPISKKKYGASDVVVNGDGFLTVDNRVTTIEVTNFLYELQQTRKGLNDHDYKRILEKTGISPSLVAKSDAKKLLQPTWNKTLVGLNSERQGKRLRNNEWTTSRLQKILKQKRSQREHGKLSDSEKFKTRVVR